MSSTLRNVALLSLCLVSAVVFASDVPATASAPLDAHLAKDADGTHVHVDLGGERNLVEFQVELFDDRGTSLSTYTIRPEDGKSFGSVMSLAFAPELASKIASARVTGIKAKPTGGTEKLFDKLLGATPASCAGMCNPTRIQCNNYCFCIGCVWATYSCTEENGCNATCDCHDCGDPGPWC